MELSEFRAPSTRRRSVKVCSLLITCLFLFVAVKMSDCDGNFATSIHKITKNLDRALVNILSENELHYTDVNDGIERRNYTSEITFRPAGMAGLYNITNKFLEYLVSDIDPALILDIRRNPKDLNDVKFKMDNLAELIRQYAGLLVLQIVLLLFVALLPLCGVCFCCCRCCGKCGARTKLADKKSDLCRKFMLGSILILLGTALLFCVVCAFGSNQQLKNGVQEFPNNMRKGVYDVNIYFNKTKRQMTNLLDNNFDEFKGNLYTIMENTSNAVMEHLMHFSNATSMTTLATFVKNIPKIKKDLHVLRNSTNTLRAYASQLNDAMRKVKKDLLGILNDCKLKQCAEFMSNISSLQTNIDFNKLPDISDEIQSFKDLDLDGLRRAVESGLTQLNRINETIQSKFNGSISQAKIKLDNAGQTMSQHLRNITSALNKATRTLNENVEPQMKQADRYIEEYGPYAYYVGLSASSILLTVAVCVALGLVCGVCGKRPDGYTDNCCNKGAGSQFLICGVSLMFFLGFILAVLTLILCVAGFVPHRLLCGELRQPHRSRLLRFAERAVDLRHHLGLNATLASIADRCRRNESLYRVLGIEGRFGLREAAQQFDVDGSLDRLDFGDAFSENFIILDDRSLSVLKELAGRGLEFNFDRFKSELENNNFTTVSLEDVKKQMDLLIGKTRDARMDNITAALEISKMDLETYDNRILKPMIDNATAVLNIAEKLNTNINMNRSSFGEAVTDLVREIESAQEEIREKGKEELKKIAGQYVAVIKGIVNGYIDRVISTTENDVGRCQDLYHVYNATLTSTCDKVLMPLNGFWFTLFWSLVLFVPTIIVSVKLASLYQKRKSNGHYMEPEYLYDAYSDRDNIPLNSRSKRNNKKKSKKPKRYEDRPQNVGPAGEVLSREYPSGSHHQDTRYADMAPKHWEDFPAGGPPQYQRAPTEYERPPPYYFPGTGDNN